MSRGLGKLQRDLVAVLAPTAEDPTPRICLADFDLPPVKYETARRALVGLEKRGLIKEIWPWRICLGQRSKWYALPVVADVWIEKMITHIEAIEDKRRTKPAIQPLYRGVSVGQPRNPTFKETQ